MTGMTTWERHEAGLPPRDRDERARFRELDAASTGPAPARCPYGSCHRSHPETGGRTS